MSGIVHAYEHYDVDPSWPSKEAGEESEGDSGTGSEANGIPLEATLIRRFRRFPVSAILADPRSMLNRRFPCPNELRRLYTGEPSDEESEGGGTEG